MMIPKEKISPDSTKQSRNCVILFMNTCFNTEMYFYVIYVFVYQYIVEIIDNAAGFHTTLTTLRRLQPYNRLEPVPTVPFITIPKGITCWHLFSGCHI